MPNSAATDPNDSPETNARNQRCRRQTARTGDMLGSAVFSACGRWRYRLTRQWNSGPQVVFIGLNPSTADAMLDDPTIRRCMDFARSWGFHGLTMINAFAFRSTDPRQLLATPDPIGPQNNRIIRNTCRNASLIIAAWGNHCPVERQTELQKLTGPLYCIAQNSNGQPAHPLYLKSSLLPQPWRRPD